MGKRNAATDLNAQTHVNTYVPKDIAMQETASGRIGSGGRGGRYEMTRLMIPNILNDERQLRLEDDKQNEFSGKLVNTTR
jgi:hypothetical protein